MAVLEESGKKFEVVEYLKSQPTMKQLKAVVQMLDMNPEELVRKNEAIWKETYKGKKMTDTAILKAMIENPKLIQRPIVIKGKKAIIARPAELLNDII